MSERPAMDRKARAAYWVFWSTIIVVLSAPTIGLFLVGEEYLWWFVALDILVGVFGWGALLWFFISREQVRSRRLELI